LLRYAARRASGFRVAHIAGVEAEMELPFAGLHQLCRPMLGQLSALPEPQRNALRVALGLSSGDAPDRFLVALAALSLLSEAAGAVVGPERSPGGRWLWAAPRRGGYSAPDRGPLPGACRRLAPGDAALDARGRGRPGRGRHGSLACRPDARNRTGGGGTGRGR